jgi:hypothetical protein
MIATASHRGQAHQTERHTMAVNTALLIERLIAQAELHDKFGPTYDGQICREAAAALAEAHNQKVIGGMLVDIIKGK